MGARRSATIGKTSEKCCNFGKIEAFVNFALFESKKKGLHAFQICNIGTNMRMTWKL